jgi:hypothetical protein
MTDTTEWKWYQAAHEDMSWDGPYDTRDDAINAGRHEWDGDGFYVAQGINPPIRLADWVDADTMIERANENLFDNDRASYEHDDWPFCPKPDAEKDLIECIKRACDEWQEHHGLVFYCNTFAEMTPPEYITGEADA